MHSVIPAARKNGETICAQSNLLFHTSGMSKKSSLRVHVVFLKILLPSLLMSNFLDGIPCKNKAAEMKEYKTQLS